MAEQFAPGTKLEEARTIDIRPGVSMLAILPHLNYKPWFALAEFVDNALQSYLANRKTLRQIHGRSFALRVAIDVEPGREGRITITDNAAGIRDEDYDRAFKPAQPPPDISGLSEFGIGMKSAACWFARSWSVRSKALGEAVERTVDWNMERIVDESVERLQVGVSLARRQDHYTEVVLSDLRRPLQTRTVTKVREHLASIYRIFLRNGQLELLFRGEPIVYHNPAVLKAPYYRDPGSRSKTWSRDVDVDLPGRKRVWGFVGIRDKGSTSEAGFAVFRHNRLILGSGDEAYRPEHIFKKSNSYTYQRVFGELHIQGFGVSHTKDAVQWEEDEERILLALHVQLSTKGMPLLDQAEGYRSRAKPQDVKAAAEAVLSTTVRAAEQGLSDQVQQQRRLSADETQDAEPAGALPRSSRPVKRTMILNLHDTDWTVDLELSADPAIGDWLTLSDTSGHSGSTRRLGIRVALAHPFMDRFAGADAERIEPLVRIAVALGLAETVARDSGATMAGSIRRNLNALLRGSLSEPG